MAGGSLSVFIFDLDGTLYDDTHHFEYYARALQTYVPAESQNSFWDDYLLAKSDQHTLRVGRVYDTETDLVLAHYNLQVEHAYRWTGEPMSHTQTQQLYPAPIVIDMRRFLSIGDLWNVPNTIALHYGVRPEQTDAAFLQTRRYMMTDEFVMKQQPELIEVLSQLKRQGKHLVLMTNSPEEDSERIIIKLGIGHLFSFKQFASQKPTMTTKRIQSFKERFQAANFSQMISIGDNWINEIAPADGLGCQTLYIDPHQIGERLACTYRADSLHEAIRLLRQLASAD